MKPLKLKSPELAATYETVMADIYRQIDVFPWHDPHAYAAWLAQSFHMTKYTTRVAALTAGSFSLEEDALHVKGLSHVREELGHEHLALNDLKHMGFKVKDFPEFLQCRLMIQSQYYFIGRHPSAHFGFVLPLETIACERGPKMTEAVQKAHGKLADSFIRIHADVDQGHAVEMIQAINMSPEHVWPMIRENLVQTGVLYNEVLVKAAQWTAAKKSAA
ncbi:MAG TPA: hypothetical protein PKC28_13010 [Bdellovibrionales bacterium]|nr:hypothetical protein [Bdellovibrionales bacterium]